MNTDDLISRLALEAPQRSRGPDHRLVLGLAVLGAVIAATIVLALFGVRADAQAATRAIGLKMAFGAVAALGLLPLLNRVLEPTTSAGRATWPILAFAAASVLVAVGSLAIAGSWDGLMLQAGAPECLKRVPLLAAPGVLLMALGARRCAPTRLGLAGATIGAFAGALAIIPYALFCNMDTAPYVGIWYLGAVAISAAVGAVLGRWLLRW